jgi:DNA-binding transcriptional regulator YdaS (Cro superfamily)
MDLRSYLKSKSRAEFARILGTTKNYVNVLACGSSRPSPSLALRIEQATDGQVTRDELLFPELYEQPNKGEAYARTDTY